MRKPRRTRGQTAFTLIEVVIAVGIIGIMMTIGYGALRSIMRARDILDDGRDARVIADSVLSRLNHELQMAVSGVSLIPPKGSSTVTSSRVPLIGSNDGSGQSATASITFVADQAGQALPDGTVGNTGLVQIEYRVMELPEEDRTAVSALALVREETPYIRPYDRAYQRQLSFPITTALTSFRLWFFDAKRLEWVDTWGDAAHEGLPSMIRYSLSIRSPSGKIDTYTSSVPLSGWKT